MSKVIFNIKFICTSFYFQSIFSYCFSEMEAQAISARSKCQSSKSKVLKISITLMYSISLPAPPLKQLWKRTKEHVCMFVNLMINDSTSRSVNILEDWNIAWGRKTSSTILHHQHETHAYLFPEDKMHAHSIIASELKKYIYVDLF